jgi:hypothetical protein
VVRRVGCVAGIGCVAVIPSAGRPGRRGATAECLFAACCVAVRTGWTLLVGYPARPGLSSLRELECRAGEPVDGECAGNPGGAKFPIDDWIALVYNRCRSRAALATISLVK